MSDNPLGGTKARVNLDYQDALAGNERPKGKDGWDFSPEIARRMNDPGTHYNRAQHLADIYNETTHWGEAAGKARWMVSDKGQLYIGQSSDEEEYSKQIAHKEWCRVIENANKIRGPEFRRDDVDKILNNMLASSFQEFSRAFPGDAARAARVHARLVSHLSSFGFMRRDEQGAWRVMAPA